MRGTAVALRGLRKAYQRDVPVVDGVDLDVAPGALVALVGPSGCGKTTTLKMVAGLLDPDAGDVRFDGRSVVRLPVEKRPVAMVFQKPLLFPHMTVGQNVGFGLRVRRAGKAAIATRVAEMLELVRLPDLVQRKVGQLSGGQEQRVALARALVTDPAVLLLDEPLSQLDAALRVEMRDLVAGVQRELGVTTLFVTHDQDEAVSLADRVALMLDGRVVQYAEPRAFYERPASMAVARFFGVRNAVPGTVAGGRFTGGGLDVAVPAGTPAGAGTLVVRQEALAVVGTGGPDVVVGRVVAARYLGTALAVSVEIDGGTRLELTAPPTTAVTVGVDVHVHLPPDACTVIPT